MNRLPRPPASGRTVRKAGSGAPASASRRSTINTSGSCPGGDGGGIFGESWPAGAGSGAASGVAPIGALAGGESWPVGAGHGVVPDSALAGGVSYAGAAGGGASGGSWLAGAARGAGRGRISGGSEPVSSYMSAASSESMAGAGVSDEAGGEDGLPDWFQGEASAALGPDWLASQISSPSVIIGEGTSQRAQRSVQPPMQATSARARGGRRTVSTSRTSTQTAPAVVDLTEARSMHDTSVLFHALTKDHNKFPHPPQGKYYHVDGGYPNWPGYLAPYKGLKYHIPDWRRGSAPEGEQERFNYLHSSIRNCVERTFGVWKMKWRILLQMPSYPLDKQKMIVAATMCLHNYIRENHALDKDFSKCDRNSDYVPTIPSRYRSSVLTNASDTSTTSSSDIQMDRFRDDIARAIFNSSISRRH